MVSLEGISQSGGNPSRAAIASADGSGVRVRFPLDENDPKRPILFFRLPQKPDGEETSSRPRTHYGNCCPVRKDVSFARSP